MGCIQSITCKSRIKRENIVVYDVSATIDQCPTVIEENSPIVLRYKTPYFKASSRVVMPPVPRNETWVVGWIQTCNQMEFYNTYSDAGMSSWELPDLREGRVKAISDSDGVSYPWYGNTTETVTLVGPTSKVSRFTVSMNDNFYPSVTWAVPVSDSNLPMLTRIKRDQSFTTWLVALNTATKEKILLQTIKWRMRVDIKWTPISPWDSVRGWWGGAGAAQSAHQDGGDPCQRPGQTQRQRRASAHVETQERTPDGGHSSQI
ncbi:protein FAM78B, partial [Huso huso]